MPKQTVYVVCADGEEELAERLAGPLHEAGYEVAHNGTIAVGESLVGEAQRAVASGSPIILCGTAKAVGSAWAHQIVNAAHGSGPTRVFVVQMEKQAFVKQLALDSKIARYCDDPARALTDLLEGLAKYFPSLVTETAATKQESRMSSSQFLDSLTDCTTFDIENLHQFRRDLRNEVVERYPTSLTPWQFLDHTGLRREGRLSGTGILLFTSNPTTVFPMAVVKCSRYYGDDRSANRDSQTFEGAIPAQIIAARQFVADRVRIGEAPSADHAQSVVFYEYPMVAVREIVANALVHRDYTSAGACVHVRIFTERMEVSSPGNWLGRDLSPGTEYALEELKGESIKRNLQLAHVLSWARLVEGEGSGIPSALRACQLGQSPAPTVRQEQGFVTVTLHKKPRLAGPADPTARLASALRDLYASANWPSIRTVGEAVGNLSESSVAEVLGGQRVPSWPLMIDILRHLGGDETKFRALWMAAATQGAMPETDSSAVNEFLVSYRRHVASRHGFLSTPDFEVRRRMPIREIYVSPSIVPEKEGQPNDLWQFDGEIGHTVLLGDPGSGKTTACDMLMYRHAVEFERPVPFFVRLRDFAATPQAARSVIGHIEDQLSAIYQLTPPPGMVAQLFRSGGGFVVFDGLDELLDADLRFDLVTIIERFAAEYRLAKILVTSRLVGYSQSRLDDDQFTCFRIGVFDQSAIDEYVHKWFITAEGRAEKVPEQLAQSFLEESSLVPDLRANPLMLGLMCVLYRGEGYLPRNRVEIYERCARLLFDTWDARRSIQTNVRLDSHIESAIRYLAWWMFTRDPQRPVSERKLVEETTAFLHRERFASEADARDAALRFVNFCRGRAWVLADVGVSPTGELLYAFTHRAFLEYFTAAYLVRSNPPEELRKVLRQKVHDPLWSVVAQIAIQLFDRNVEGGAELLIMDLVDEANGSGAQDRIRILEFARGCAQLLDLPTTSVSRHTDNESTTG